MKYSFFPPPLRWNILILKSYVHFWAPCVLWYSSNTFFFCLVASLCCCCSLARSCLILCDPTDGSMPGSSVLHSLPEFAQIHIHWVTVCVKVAQSYLTLCDPMDYTVHGTVQARILDWVAFPFSRGSSQLGDWTQVSCIAGGFFASWATREAQTEYYLAIKIKILPFAAKWMKSREYYASWNERKTKYCISLYMESER